MDMIHDHSNYNKPLDMIVMSIITMNDALIAKKELSSFNSL